MKTFIFIVITLIIIILISLRLKSGPKKFEFSIVEINDTLKVSEPISVEQFWAIVENEKNLSESQYLDSVRSNLDQLTASDIIGFHLRMEILLEESYNSELWCACFLMNSGCSDDGFQYFRYWLISKGRNIFEKTSENPDILANTNKKVFSSFELEPFGFLPAEVFQGKTGKFLFDFIDREEFKRKYPFDYSIEFNWKEDEPETMQAICPKLFDKFH